VFSVIIVRLSLLLPAKLNISKFPERAQKRTLSAKVSYSTHQNLVESGVGALSFSAGGGLFFIFDTIAESVYTGYSVRTNTLNEI
jgi:hypothetical protein